MLTAFDWPGNVRQLENIIERAVIMSEGNKITPDYLPNYIRNQKQSYYEKITL